MGRARRHGRGLRAPRRERRITIRDGGALQSRARDVASRGAEDARRVRGRARVRSRAEGRSWPRGSRSERSRSASWIRDDTPKSYGSSTTTSRRSRPPATCSWQRAFGAGARPRTRRREIWKQQSSSSSRCSRPRSASGAGTRWCSPGMWRSMRRAVGSRSRASGEHFETRNVTTHPPSIGNMPLLARTAAAVGETQRAAEFVDQVYPGFGFPVPRHACGRGAGGARTRRRRLRTRSRPGELGRRAVGASFRAFPERGHALLLRGKAKIALGDSSGSEDIRAARDVFAELGMRPALAEVEALLEGEVAAEA